jgi:hypothetical protein
VVGLHPAPEELVEGGPSRLQGGLCRLPARGPERGDAGHREKPPAIKGAVHHGPTRNFLELRDRFRLSLAPCLVWASMGPPEKGDEIMKVKTSIKAGTIVLEE